VGRRNKKSCKRRKESGKDIKNVTLLHGKKGVKEG